MSIPDLVTLYLAVAMATGSVSAADPPVPFYSAASSRTIRPFSSYDVTIFVEKSPAEADVTSPLEFSATVTSDKESYSGEISVTPGSYSVLKIRVGELKANEYNLTVRVRRDGSHLGTNSVSISTSSSREDKILIQTDKPVYKPGEVVRFRVFVLEDQDFKPQNDVKLTVKIKDAEENVIKVWTDKIPSNGLFKEQLQLSTEPVLGSWTIKVEVKGQGNKSSDVKIPQSADDSPSASADEDDNYDSSPGEVTQKRSLVFHVDKYVLPKFEVTVKAPTFITRSSTETIHIQISAKYTHGKGVTGQVTLRSKPYYYFSPSKAIIVSTVDIVDGFAEVDLDAHDLLESTQFVTQFEFEASVTENVTGIVRNGTGNTVVHDHAHVIEPVELEASKVLKPGLPFKISFRLRTQDGKPLADPDEHALEITNWLENPHEEETFHSPIPPDGLISMTIDTAEHDRLERIDLNYKGVHQTYYFPQVCTSDNQAFIQIAFPEGGDGVITAGQTFSVLLNSTKPLSQLNYIIVGVGEEILASSKVDIRPGALEQKLEIECPVRASPEARLVAFAVLNDGTAIGDSILLRVRGRSNFLTITTSVVSGEPGDNVTLTVNSTKGSTVALRGVDQSVLLLLGDHEEDTDITQGRLDEQIRKENLIPSVNALCRLPRLFKQLGLSVLSNSKLYSEGESGDYYADDDLEVQEARFDMEPLAFRREEAAGDASDNSASNNAPQPRPLRVRSNFPETWIWEESTLDNDAQSVQLTKTLPDTLTSWIITGFSLNPNTGIGILQNPTKITTFRPFFLTLNLPYSVIRGETLVLQVLIHNYLGQEASVEVTLDNSEGHFAFAERSLKDSKVGTKKLSAKSNQVTAIEFPIVPLKFGSIILDVKGVTGVAGDALSQPLRVTPPGQRFRRSQSQLLTAESATQAAPAQLSASFPSERVEGADQVRLSLTADIMGHTTENLDSLLDMPTGCGEQNMINFVPDIVILDYLQSVNSLSTSIRSKAVRYLEIGYQRELTYKHSDGSYSAFGRQDKSGSTWLTAFVVRSFIAAKSHIYVDDDVISGALRYLAEKQQKDSGKFVEHGRIIHSGMQGGSSTSGVALTAYVAIALIEADLASSKNDASADYSQQITQALEYIVKKTSEADQDSYTIVITTYVLHLANHSEKDVYFERMDREAKSKGGFRYWTVPESPQWTEETDGGTKPIAVEMTAYGLLTYLLRGQAPEAVPIVRWLLKQRNPSGGFISTQDTVVGLTALAKYAQITKSPVTDLVVNIDYGEQQRKISIKDADAEVLQQIVLPADTRKISVFVEGKGSVLLTLDWEYYVEQSQEKPAFDLKITSTELAYRLKFRSCVSYLDNGASNMAIVEVNVPSGYSVDRDSLEDLKKVAAYKRYDLQNGDSRVSLYFDSFSAEQTCFNVIANHVFKVGNPVASYVSVYDYYDTTRRATAYYEPPKVSLCDTCQGNYDCDLDNCI